MKILLLLTHSFPYGSGEDFISAELKYISGFDKVFICPCSREKDAIQTKPIPDSIKCMPVSRTDLGKKEYIRLLFYPCIAGEIFSLMRTGRLQCSRVHEMLFFMRNAREIYNGLKQSVNINQDDEVLIYSYWLYDAAAAGVWLASYIRKMGVKVHQVSRAHRFDIYSSLAHYNYLPMRRWLFEHIDHIYPCSNDGAEALCAEAGPYAEKISRSYLGTVDHGYGMVSQKPFHIISCSFISPVKRLNLIAEALQQANFPVAWTHIGSGPLEQQLRDAAKKFPQNVSAEFSGQKKNSEVLEYYKKNQISVFVNVSSSEGIPVTIMEACSFGIPVIATDVGGTHEIITNGVNGFLLPKDFSTQEFLGLLRRIYEMDESDYRAMCVNARKSWEKNFDAAKNYRSFYSGLAALTEGEQQKA